VNLRDRARAPVKAPMEAAARAAALARRAKTSWQAVPASRSSSQSGEHSAPPGVGRQVRRTVLMSVSIQSTSARRASPRQPPATAGGVPRSDCPSAVAWARGSVSPCGGYQRWRSRCRRRARHLPAGRSRPA